MGFRIAKVERGGLADELGLRRGDELLEINGERLVDLIDYQQLINAILCPGDTIFAYRGCIFCCIIFV